MWLFDLFFPQFCKSDMSRYGYLEVFQRDLDFEVIGVNCICFYREIRKMILLKKKCTLSGAMMDRLQREHSKLTVLAPPLSPKPLFKERLAEEKLLLWYTSPFSKRATFKRKNLLLVTLRGTCSLGLLNRWALW